MESLEFRNLPIKSKQQKAKGTLQKSLRFFMVIAHVLAQFPLNGTLKDDAKYLQFTWRSFKTINTFLFISCILAVIIIDLLQILKNGTDIFIISK